MFLASLVACLRSDCDNLVKMVDLLIVFPIVFGDSLRFLFSYNLTSYSSDFFDDCISLEISCFLNFYGPT